MTRAGKEVDDDDDRIEDRILIDFYTQSAQKKQVGVYRDWTFRELLPAQWDSSNKMIIGFSINGF
jgi:hypothetical protein